MNAPTKGSLTGLRNFGLRGRNFLKEWRLFTLLFAGQRLIRDYRFTWPQMEWWRNPEFNAYLERFGERRRFNTHRRWMLWQLLGLIEAVEGDTAECGVFKGAGSWLICAANQGTDRTHHLFDSFEGLSAPEANDGAYWKLGDLSAGEEEVCRNLEPFAEQLSFHKGWIPDRFPDVADKKFAFVHIDVDLRQPTLASFEFFYPRLSPGAILLCDDYAFTSCPGATEAIDTFLVGKPEAMIALDGGGGFVIKGAAVSKNRSPLPKFSGDLLKY